MNIYDLIVLIIIVLLIAMFWRYRATSEAVKIYLEKYCEQRNLQLISVARHKTKVSSYRGKLDFKSEYSFEFSGNGEDSYQGQVIMIGLKVLDIELPAYRVE
ncbi:DUF3301 domain-containing protein [Paraglaciecola aquimarina]|uniref:DUF3301 domain-containing protein n=1 Tax=Paraglaciecola algarum TaxID=3050085 RepID=A0ABS9D5X8_9ALTE|nr:DUF3301 domain-containing protein [Paraglaciecola sp. G1-23]MCF2948357.1 DUF3301 domain-containing protein [Paraglaciecola sp. G1-23]